ncbi:Serine beta-lactamase-like protein LACTB [Sesbania bispinosa]|nr:Serine beta-lactamase-like protein LACTB [Sesbania bispinosa]
MYQGGWKVSRLERLEDWPDRKAVRLASQMTGRLAGQKGWRGEMRKTTPF